MELSSGAESSFLIYILNYSWGERILNIRNMLELFYNYFASENKSVSYYCEWMNYFVHFKIPALFALTRFYKY